jgi:hypothetical protein
MTWNIGKQRLKTAPITAHFVIEEVMGEEDLERVVVMTDEPMSPSVNSLRTASATTPSRLATWRRWKQQEKPT